MIKRPSRDETFDDILRQQVEYNANKQKDSKVQPAAVVVKTAQYEHAKKSIYAKNRYQQQEEDIDAKFKDNTVARDHIVFGEIIERNENTSFVAPKQSEKLNPTTMSVKMANNNMLSAEIVEEPEKSDDDGGDEILYADKLLEDHFAVFCRTESLKTDMMKQHDDDRKGSNQLGMATYFHSIFGERTEIAQDVNLALMLHEENLEKFSSSSEKEILRERCKLLNEMDPGLVKFLTQRRLQNEQKAKQNGVPLPKKSEEWVNTVKNYIFESHLVKRMLDSAEDEKWINFDTVENEKINWLSDVSEKRTKLKVGEQFEARFDWNGVLQPYDILSQPESDRYERELYMHNDDPQRAGYTLQELFRYARSNILQQRITAFKAIGGILNMYQQGFYDHAVDLPLAKIFFLLRYGFDDNTPVVLEAVAKALALLCYNEADETLLDFFYENPFCYREPNLLVDDSLNDETTVEESSISSIEHARQEFQKLQLNNKKLEPKSSIGTNVEMESYEEPDESMNHLELADTDLMECLMQSNILKRISYIINVLQPENSTVTSCLKILIRLARSKIENAIQIASCEDLISGLSEHFLPKIELMTVKLSEKKFYGYPQLLCLKLIRVLVASNKHIAKALISIVDLNGVLEQNLTSYYNLRGDMIRIQVESLRIYRALIMLRCDSSIYRKFLPALYYMLRCSNKQMVHEEGGNFLLHQHTAAVLAGITSGMVKNNKEDQEAFEMLMDCFCSKFHFAQKFGIKEFSQLTLLSQCLHGYLWCLKQNSTVVEIFEITYLPAFLNSDSFTKLLDEMIKSSLLLSKDIDRRNVNKTLPNLGSVVTKKNGPALIISQTYSMHLMLGLLGLSCYSTNIEKCLSDCGIFKYFEDYLKEMCSFKHRYMASNFFAKTEVMFVFKLLTTDKIEQHLTLTRREKYIIAYNLIISLPRDYKNEIEILFKNIIFNENYLNVEPDVLQKCAHIYFNQIVCPGPEELEEDANLFASGIQCPVLAADWPYHLLNNLQNENVAEDETINNSESEILEVTLRFTDALAEMAPIISPTRRLMYYMVMFLGPDSDFLEPKIDDLLRKSLLKFIASSTDVTFQFDCMLTGVLSFESLYYKVLERYQEASYGNDLFSAVVLMPLAQKYDIKWRFLVWSEFQNILFSLHCSETLLIGGIQSYLEPPETNEQLLTAYSDVLHNVRPKRLPYKIAFHHIKEWNIRKSSDDPSMNT